jgi:hypothetical protein
MLDEEVDNQVMTLPGSIEQWGLIQAVQKVGFDSNLSEDLNHLQRSILILNNGSRKHHILFPSVLIEQVSNVNAKFVSLLNY